MIMEVCPRVIARVVARVVARVPTYASTCHIVQLILFKGPCASLYQFVFQLLGFLGQLLQLLLLSLKLLLC